MDTSKRAHFLSRAVFENAKWLDDILFKAMLLAAALTALKITRAPLNFWGLPGIGFPLGPDVALPAFSIFTLIHSYAAIMFIQSAERLAATGLTELAQITYLEIVTVGGGLLRGLTPGARIVTGPGQRHTRTNKSDLSRWLLGVIAPLILIAAMVPFEVTDWKQLVIFLSIALAIVYLNWLIGVQWVWRLSMLDTRLSSVEIVDGFTVHIHYSNGDHETADLAPLLKGEALEEVRDNPEMFTTIRLDDDAATIEWENGAQLDADLLYGRHLSRWMQPRLRYKPASKSRNRS